MKRIVRYLIGTQDKGISFSVEDPIIQCFADADFAGNWDKTDPEDPENVSPDLATSLSLQDVPSTGDQSSRT